MFEGKEFILPLLFAIVTLLVDALPMPAASKYVFHDTLAIFTNTYEEKLPSLYMPPLVK